mmetsp:Transcript_35992/g.106386  ORF Transcript_35992/g.106386 Transcript_35992/m.106386 type:complete len:472 (-) Transcript_35992:4143-5558(-)
MLITPDAYGKPAKRAGASGSVQPGSASGSARLRDAAPPASPRQSGTSVVEAALLEGGGEDDDITGQAVEILAGLTSLGISKEIRERVQEALDQLDSATESASQGVTELLARKQHGTAAAKVASPAVAAGRGRAAKAGASAASGPVAPAAQAQVEELENKLAMSRSIMRKLYRKNVDLEKELSMLRTNGCDVTSLELTPKDTHDAVDTARTCGAAALASARGAAHGASGGDASAALPMPTTRPGGPAVAVGALEVGTSSPSTPVARLIQERDMTITQLQAALDASRRRCALLEAQGGGVGGPSGGDGSRGGGSGGVGGALAAQQASIREVLAASQLHLSKYQNIREDYNRLLKRRTAAVSTSKAASAEARALVNEMHSRLAKEMEEREAEAALYSARLYESERQMSDWYAEKRMLEQQIKNLSEEVSQRDHMDQEMEACVCDLFEKLRLMEESNKQLTAKLGAAGAQVAAAQ